MVHLERWFCRRNFHFTEVEVTERVISTLLPMEWKLLFHFRPEKGYIPTDKAPKEAVEAMKEYNEEYFWHPERLK